MKSAAMKVPGGKMIRVSVDVKDGCIARISITGDFFLHPEDLLPPMERLLEGQRIVAENLADSIGDFLVKNNAVLIGASSTDLAKVITMAASSPDG